MTEYPEQPRRRGRYAEMPLDDAGQLALDSGRLDLGSAGDGTFEFPPLLPDASRIVQFWTEVEVPEEALVSTVAAYSARQQQHMATLEKEYSATKPPPVRQERFPAWAAERDAWVAGRLELPASIPAPWVRPLVRLAKMHESAQYLRNNRPDDQTAVANLIVTFPGGKAKTTAEWLEQYRVLELLPQIANFKRRVDAIRTSQNLNSQS